MRCLFLVVIFSFLISSITFAQNNGIKKTTHIQNPSFGASSRFQIIEDNSSEVQEEEVPSSIKEKPLSINPSSTRNYSTEKIQESKSQNIQDFLQENGFLVMTTGGTGSKSELSYKGYTGFCIKVYINGVLANNSTTGEFDWNTIDLNSIESIEICEVPELDEAEFAGCIIRITTKFSEERAMMEISGAGYENSIVDEIKCRTYFAKGIDKFVYNVGIDFYHAKNQFERVPVLGTNFDNFTTSGIFNYGWNVDLNENIRLYGNNVLSYSRLKAFGTGSDYDTGIEEDISSRNNINFLYKSDVLKSDSALSFNLGNVKYVYSYRLNNIDNTNFGKIALTERLIWFLDITAGVNYEWLPSNIMNDRLTANIGIGKKFIFGDFSIEPQLVGLFWNNESFGARILPRLNFSWQGVNVSLYRSCILPTFNQLYWPDTGYECGNINLNPEEGWAAFVGFKRDDFPLWAQYTFSYYGNKIRWSGEHGRLQPENTADALYNVVTLGCDFSFFDNQLKITADGTYIGAKLCATGKQIMWVPEWQAHVGLYGKIYKFRIGIDYSFTSFRYSSNDNSFYYPASNILNTVISFNPRNELEFYLKATNLLDQRIPYHDNYYMPSRKITLGVKITGPLAQK